MRLLLRVNLLVACLGFVGIARADSVDDEILRAARERGVEAEMRAGKAALDSGQAEVAAASYAAAVKKAPGFGHALRRHCAAEAQLGHAERAEALCREALAADPSPRNQSALAFMLSRHGDAAKRAEAERLVDTARAAAPDLDAVHLAAFELALGSNDVQRVRAALAEVRRTATAPDTTASGLVRLAGFLLEPTRRDENKDEANRLAIEALELAPEDLGTLIGVAGVALNVEDQPLFEKASSRLESVAPKLSHTHHFAAIRHVMHGEWDQARSALEKARALGLAAEPYESLLAHIDQGEPWTAGLWPLVLRIVVGWFATLLGLLLLGMLLSALTLRTARDLPREANGKSSGASLVLRRLYGAVIALACAFYYLSLPLVIAAVLAAAGGVFYAFIELGRIPIKLMLILALLALVTVWAVLKSVFVRARDADPGTRLDLAREPGLRGLLDEVAQKVGTRAVDAVYLTPGTDVAVFERGGLIKQLSGRSERCLVLGLGVLDDMRLSDFKAVLAHEYGHFSNRDTAGGGLALAVRRSLLVMAHSLAEGGAAAWYNPAWWFFRGFFAVFLRISQGASRLQEVLADRWAAFSYGSEAFVRGLTHVIDRSVRFGAQANVALAPATESRTPLINFYGSLRETAVAEDDIAREVQQAIDRKPSPYDSHPAPCDRIAWVRALRAHEPAPSDERSVWSIFVEREQLEKEMTNEVNQALGLSHGPFVPSQPFEEFS